MTIKKTIISFILLTILAPFAYATKCGQVIYNKHGMWRKYDYLPLDLSELTKKHGVISWTSPATTETSTASVDPGVTTGASDSQTQSVSTKGDCKWGGFFGVIDSEDFEKYVEQNMNEIKTQMAVGKGGHIEVISGFLGCGQNVTIGSTLQKSMPQFVDLKTEESKLFVEKLHKVVANQCPANQVAGI